MVSFCFVHVECDKKNQRLPKNILKRPRDKFSRCTTCEKYKNIADAQHTCIESYTSHQNTHTHIKHVNNEEAHYQYYYKNRALSIMRPMEVLIVIHVKMDHVKTTCHYQDFMVLRNHQCTLHVPFLKVLKCNPL